MLSDICLPLLNRYLDNTLNNFIDHFFVNMAKYKDKLEHYCRVMETTHILSIKEKDCREKIKYDRNLEPKGRFLL